MNNSTKKQEEELIIYAHRRVKIKGFNGSDKNRQYYVIAAVSDYCKILNITRKEFYLAPISQLENWYPMIEITRSHNPDKYKKADYIFRIRLEQLGSTIAPIRNKNASRIRTNDKSNLIAKENVAQEAHPDGIKVIVKSKGNVEITVSNDDGRLNYSILQLQ